MVITFMLLTGGQSCEILAANLNYPVLIHVASLFGSGTYDIFVKIDGADKNVSVNMALVEQ